MIDLKKYDYDAELLFKQLTPSSFYMEDSQTEKDKYVKFLYSIGSVFTKIKNDLYNEVVNIRRQLSYNWTTRQIERMLNDTFDASLRRITIRNFLGESNIFYDFYLIGETDPTPLTFYLRGETDPSPKSFFLDESIIGGVNFIIYLNGVIVNNTLLERLVNKYKKINKTYIYV